MISTLAYPFWMIKKPNFFITKVEWKIFQNNYSMYFILPACSTPPAPVWPCPGALPACLACSWPCWSALTTHEETAAVAQLLSSHHRDPGIQTSHSHQHTQGGTHSTLARLGGCRTGKGVSWRKVVMVKDPDDQLLTLHSLACLFPPTCHVYLVLISLVLISLVMSPYSSHSCHMGLVW